MRTNISVVFQVDYRSEGDLQRINARLAR